MRWCVFAGKKEKKEIVTRKSSDSKIVTRITFLSTAGLDVAEETVSSLSRLRSARAFSQEIVNLHYIAPFIQELLIWCRLRSKQAAVVTKLIAPLNLHVSARIYTYI